MNYWCRDARAATAAGNCRARKRQKRAKLRQLDHYNFTFALARNQNVIPRKASEGLSLDRSNTGASLWLLLVYVYGLHFT